MTLPRGWRETVTRSNRSGSWRFQVRRPERFRTGTLRTVPLTGVRGVKLIAGKLQGGDRELDRHGPDAMVPQAVIYDKAAWPQFRDALAWNEAHFSAIDNPPRRRNPDDEGGELAELERQHEFAFHEFAKAHGSMTVEEARRVARAKDEAGAGRVMAKLKGRLGDAYRNMKAIEGKIHALRISGPENVCECGAPGKNPVPIGGGWALACDKCKRASIRSGETTAADWKHWKREAFGDNPPRRSNPSKPWEQMSEREQLEHNIQAAERLAETAERKGHAGMAAWHRRVARAYRQVLGELREKNPPAEPRRVGAFRAGAAAAIERLVRTETELSGIFAQALELIDRGEKVPDWIRERARGLQLERAAQVEAVKTAVGRHGAAIEEFHVPRRRENPSGERAAAVKLYRDFHGDEPHSFRTQRIPDLHQLVHLGRALRVDYQAARQRGPRGTPYRHEFAAGSELFTDRTGRALVILGNLKVSRAPRGRFGYIRAGAGA